LSFSEAAGVEGGDTEVRAALAVSYRMLPAPAARLFRLLGLHGGLQPEQPACAALAGTSVVAVRGDLDDLLEGHLLTKAGPGRYAMHDLVRLYARERAEAEEAPADRAAALRRVFAWYLYAAAEVAGATQPHVTRFAYPAAEPTQELPAVSTAAAAVAWADDELPNLTAMLDTVRQTGWVDPPGSWPTRSRRFSVSAPTCAPGSTCPRSASTCNSLSASLLLLGRYTECVDTATVALAEASEQRDLRPAAYACAHLGDASTALGRYEEALTHFEEARRTAGSAGRARCRRRRC
jgi:tetratricopeptide (TPR) repeat protein